MFKKLPIVILVSLVFLVPLFFLPITSGFYDFNKNALLICLVSLLLINWLVEMILKKRIRLITTPLDLPVLFLLFSFLVSFAFQSINKKEVLFVPGGIGTMLALTLLYFFITQTKARRKLLTSFIVSASLLSAISIFFFLNWWQAWGVKLPDWLAQPFFSPTGGLLPQATVLGVALVLLIAKVRTRFAAKSVAETTLATQKKTPLIYMLLSLIFVIVGLGVTVYQLATTQKLNLLPYSYGWAIAVETLKTFRTALFGVGPLNFLSAFTRFKPLGFNATSVWNLRFTSSSNWYFQLLTETGILSLAAYLFLVYRVIKKKSSLLAVRYSLLAIFLLQLFLPANFLLLFTFFVFLGLYASGVPERKEIIEESQILPWLTTIIFSVLLAFGLYSAGSSYAAEIYFKRSLDALIENRGVDTYNLQIRALTLAPYRTNYRLAYSQINFALANAIASKTDLTDQDRSNISQLVQQAIREGKTAVDLNPINVVSWENLAGVYQNLINFAQGSDQWTYATYAQAISLDPLNPQLRIALGGVYYGLKNYDEAARIFRIAVDLKPDLANAHYNLAAALRERGDYRSAAQEMQTTLSLVEPETNDFKKVSQEFEDLRSKISLEAPEATPPGQLETLRPPATPPAGIEPPLELPEEAKPEITPIPTEEAMPTETPAP